MKIITFDNPHRQKHFDFFKNMNHPHFNICANVDITELSAHLKANSLPFTATMVYLISKAANSIKEFRWRIREGQVMEHPSVHPSFTVLTEASDVFSFCYVDYVENYVSFVENAQKAIKNMQTAPSFEDEEHRDDYLFLSSFPWVSFTGFQHAMSFHPHDSVPRITWGKLIKENGRIKMPLSVQAHHAIVDGRHTGMYFQQMERWGRMEEPFF